MTYVDAIEPRLTPHRPSRPATTGEVLVEFCEDLVEELSARLDLLDADALAWQPHPDGNSVAVTAWHVARWLDVLGTRVFSGSPAHADAWHIEGWADRTGYEPAGKGYLGFGTLTGYTPAEMREVPVLDRESLQAYLRQSATRLVDEIQRLEPVLVDDTGMGLSPYQIIGSTLQGSFGHVGEIDALVALRHRLGKQRSGA